MNSHMLSTRVTVVPSSVHQRINSSCPLGKNSKTSANTLGTKMTADINIRSYSTCMGQFSDYCFIHQARRAGGVSPLRKGAEDTQEANAPRSPVHRAGAALAKYNSRINRP